MMVSCVLGFSYSTNRLSDFAGYYTAARLFIEEDSLGLMYDDHWFKEQVEELGIDEPTVVMYVNPPSVSFLMLPVVWLDPFVAKAAWNAISVLLVMIVLLLARRSLMIPAHSGYSALLLVLLSSSIPFLRNLQRGQVYVLLLLLVLLLWIGYREDKPWLSGVSLALLLTMKYFGWMFLLLFAVERKWKYVGTTALSTVFALSFSVILFGPAMYVEHYGRLIAALRDMDFAITGLPAVQAFFGGLFVFHPWWNPNPVANLPWLASILTVAGLGSALMFTLRTNRETSIETNHHKFLALVTLSVIFTPLAADHHYILLALPLFVMVSSIDWQHQGHSLRIGAALVSYLLIGWLPIPSAASLDGWMKLVGYPRLYGAVALWFLLVHLFHRGLLPYVNRE